jgi:dephospho-CoA kinase
MNDKIVLGLSGKIASGKDTIADYIVEKYGGVSVSFSKPLRDILNIAYLPINRSNLSWLAQALVDKFGGDVISNIVGKEIEKSDKKIFVLPNIRRSDDVSYFRNWDGYFSVGINTDPKICYERLIKRGQNIDDNTKTWEEFQKDLLLSTEVEIDKLAESATFRIDNNGTLEDLYKQIDQIIEEVKNKPN